MTLSNIVSVIQQLLKFSLKVYGHHHHHYDQYNCLFQMRQNSLLLRIVGPGDRMQKKKKKSITWLSSLLVYPPCHLTKKFCFFNVKQGNWRPSLYLSLSLFFFSATLCSMWDHSSPTRDLTLTPCSGSTESYPLDSQGTPWSPPLDPQLSVHVIYVVITSWGRSIKFRACILEYHKHGLALVLSCVSFGKFIYTLWAISHL